MRCGIAIAACLACSTPALADEVHATVEPEPAPSKNLFYVELGGKAGLYGVGYERRLTKRLSIGAAGSFAPIRDQQILTLTPYLHLPLLDGKRNALFTELGASFVHSSIASPVDDWDGMTDSGGGGFASLGWERRSRHLVFRAAASFVVGEGGVAPWFGLAIGVR
jgi:hypothetical protein